MTKFSSSFLLRHTIFPRCISGSTVDVPTSNTPLELLLSIDVPFWCFIDTAFHFLVKSPKIHHKGATLSIQQGAGHDSSVNCLPFNRGAKQSETDIHRKKTTLSLKPSQELNNNLQYKNAH